jgi:hypothetical protein
MAEPLKVGPIEEGTRVQNQWAQPLFFFNLRILFLIRRKLKYTGYILQTYTMVLVKQLKVHRKW